MELNKRAGCGAFLGFALGVAGALSGFLIIVFFESGRNPVTPSQEAPLGYAVGIILMFVSVLVVAFFSLIFAIALAKSPSERALALRASAVACLFIGGYPLAVFWFTPADDSTAAVAAIVELALIAIGFGWWLAARNRIRTEMMETEPPENTAEA